MQCSRWLTILQEEMAIVDGQLPCTFQLGDMRSALSTIFAGGNLTYSLALTLSHQLLLSISESNGECAIHFLKLAFASPENSPMQEI